MKKSTIVLLVIVGVIAFIGLSIVSVYNRLVTDSKTVDTSWSQVETQYQRRIDLIPNLVNATKGYLKQEQKVFGDIADARTHYANSAPGSADRVNSLSSLDSAVGRLLVIMENYPELQSNKTVADLMAEISGTENRINIARQRYNESVQTFDTEIKTFPTVIIASSFGFADKPFFEANKGAENAPTVNLLN